MRIALDYDGTYDQDPEMWDDFIRLCDLQGHTVFIVTYRDHRHDWTPLFDHLEINMGAKVYCTGGVAKKWWCQHFGPGEIDVWIDDKPETLLNNSTASPEWLKEWRQNS